MPEDARDKSFKVEVFPRDVYGFVGLLIVCATVLICVDMVVTLTPKGGKVQIGFSEFQISSSGPPPTEMMGYSNRKLIGFWTPSEDTLKQFCPNSDLENAKNKQQCVDTCIHTLKKAQDRWECTVTEAQEQEFGRELLASFNQGQGKQDDAAWSPFLFGRLLDRARRPDQPSRIVTGFHRYAEAGRGYSGIEKRGTWWDVTVGKDFSLRDFARFYTDYWCKIDKAGKETSNFDADCREKPVYIEQLDGTADYSGRQ